MAYTWFILLMVGCGAALMLLLLHGTPVGDLVHDRIPDRPRRRLFTATVSFILTFGAVRAVVYAITHQIPPFHFVIVGGRHIHHLVFGIIILLAFGYASLAEIGMGAGKWSILAGRFLSILYGVGAALTLDEFALWLNLRDVYWSPEGRASIDATVLFAALLAAGTWGAPLFFAGPRKQARRR
jgi:hypothetical protein